ncbi:MAG: hypothetical protein DRH89_03880 [Candidatus Cloacimonadota bacterium]|nr:MAG: hypothetical protein DRI23_06335 [Candidatus Cloacimonadota bacterium]RLC57273.1 MAG: hypothetical protein DRH89_03880 [Candidatus Cloacimonadota bacterium]
MKCKGTLFEKKTFGKKAARMCNAQLAEHQIYCNKCGTATKALSTGLSAKQNRTEAWQQFKEIKSKYYPFAIFMILAVFSFIGASVVLGTRHFLYNNLALLFIVPLALIPFSFEKDFINYPFTIGMFFKHLKHYPKYFLFVLINILWFIFLKILCTGAFIHIATDPILHEVRLILALYWIVIMLPAPILMIRRKMNPIKAMILCYKATAETRWQQFFIVFYLAVINLIGLATAGLGLLVTIPFSYILIERYFLRMDEYELFDTDGRGYYVQKEK